MQSSVNMGTCLSRWRPQIVRQTRVHFPVERQSASGYFTPSCSKKMVMRSFYDRKPIDADSNSDCPYDAPWNWNEKWNWQTKIRISSNEKKITIKYAIMASREGRHKLLAHNLSWLSVFCASANRQADDDKSCNHSKPRGLVQHSWRLRASA